MGKVMKSRTTYFSVLAILLSVLASCSKKPETIVTELYKSIYDGEWEKAVPMILPDSLENLTPDEIKFLGEEFSRYFPEGRVIESIKTDSASYNESKDKITYAVTVNFNDSTTFTEHGSLMKNAEGKWKLTNYMPEEGEKIPFEITLFEYPIEMKPNLKRAMIMLGAERNLPEYQYYAAPYYIYAPYPVDREKYESLLKEASDAEYLPAMLQLANIYYSKSDNRTGKLIMFDQYLELIKKAASKGDIEGKMKLAWLQFKGESGIPKDIESAKKAFETALESGFGEGGWGLGYMYGNGYLGKQDRVKALEYYKKGSELGCSDASWNVYYYYANGLGTKKDRKEADKWFVKSWGQIGGYEIKEYKPNMQFDPQINYEQNLSRILHGDTEGFCYENIGNAYEFGKGVEQDLEKAKYCYRRDAALRDDSSRKSQIRSRGFVKNPVIPIEEFKEIYK